MITIKFFLKLGRKFFITIILYFERLYVIIFYRHTINDLKIRRDIKYDSLDVYVTFRYRISGYRYRQHIKSYYLDQSGVRRYVYKGELYYNPIQIAQQGLSEYGYFLRNKSNQHLNTMINIGEWLIENQDKKNGAWYFDFDYMNLNVNCMLKKPWISAMGQGQCISFLCRLNHLYPDERFIVACKKALKPFYINVEDGGVLTYFNDNIFFEEYPTKPQSFTLNGFMYAIIGLYDMYNLLKDDEAEKLFYEGIKTLEKILCFYDDSHLTYYDLGHMTAPLRKPNQNSKYHVLHVILLQNISSIVKSETIDFYKEKWIKQ